MIARGSLIAVAMLLVLAAVASADNAVILEQSGTVTVTAAGGEGVVAALTGQPLTPGDVVSTGRDGTVVILLSDGSRVDLFPNSRLQVREPVPDDNEGGFLRRLWRSITGKFSDSEFASAQAGRVGAFRAAADDEEMFNDYATAAEFDEMDALLASIDAEDLPDSTAALMRAIVYEDYGQFIPAEEIYLARIESFPQEPITYDMLFDMYLKMDFYGHAAAISEKKAEIFPAE